MLLAFRSFRSSVFLRAISIGCVIVAFCYIFFEMLNLDGSTLPLQRFPVENTAIVPQVETNLVRPYLTRLALPWSDISLFLLPEQADCVRPRRIENSKASAFNSLQRREQHLRVSIGFVRALQCRWVQKGESDEHDK